jgi:hypothetical protein
MRHDLHDACDHSGCSEPLLRGSVEEHPLDDSTCDGDGCHRPQDNERMTGEREQSTNDSVADLRCSLSHITGRWSACVVWISSSLACAG